MVFVKSADGTEIFTEAVGDSSKPGLILIHGFCLSGMIFDGIFEDPKWRELFFLVRYDIRGHGRSGKPTDPESWTSRRLADDFDAVIDAFKLVKPFIAPWSISGTHVADILSFHPPSYIKGIISIAGFLYTSSIMPSATSEGTGTPYAFGVVGALTQTSDVVAYRDGVLTFMAGVSDHLDFKTKQICMGNALMVPSAALQQMMARTQDETGFIEAGKTLPLMVIYGKKDKLIKMQAVIQLLQKHEWKNLHVVEIENPEVDHVPWLLEPDVFREEVFVWAKRHL